MNCFYNSLLFSLAFSEFRCPSNSNNFIAEVDLKMSCSKVIVNLQITLESREISHWIDPTILSVIWALRDVGGRVNLLCPIHTPPAQDFKDLDHFFLSLYISRTKGSILIYPWMALLPLPPWSLSMSSSSLPPVSSCLLKVCPELHTIFPEIRELGFYLYPLMLKNLITIKWIILRNLYWNLSPKSFIPSFTYSLSCSVRN